MNDQVTNLAEKGVTSVLLGSAQLDKFKEDIALSPGSEYRVVFVTPEWISKPEKQRKIKQLVLGNCLSLIAIDEAHLFHQIMARVSKCIQVVGKPKFGIPNCPYYGSYCYCTSRSNGKHAEASQGALGVEV